MQSNLSAIEVRQQVVEFIATYSHLPNVQKLRQALAVGLVSYEQAYEIAKRSLVVAISEVAA